MPHPCNIRSMALLVCSLLSLQRGAHASAPPLEHPLAGLNQHARTIYAQARNEMLRAADPVVVVFSSNKLVLMHEGQQESFAYVPSRVQGLKAIAHGALAAWTLLERSTGDPAAWHPLAQEFASAMEHAQSQLGPYEFTPEQTARQDRIMQGVVEALRLSPMPDAQAVDVFAATMAPWVMANVSDAAALILDGLNSRMHQVKARLGDEKFAAMRVVVVGGHMARGGELAAQYVQRLYNDEAEGQRWVYAENTRDEAEALDTLGVHLIDNAASLAFFGNSVRLHRDVLSDVARQHIESLSFPTL